MSVLIAINRDLWTVLSQITLVGKQFSNLSQKTEVGNSETTKPEIAKPESIIPEIPMSKIIKPKVIRPQIVNARATGEALNLYKGYLKSEAILSNFLFIVYKQKRLVNMEVQISVVTADWTRRAEDVRLNNTFRRIIIRLEEDPGTLPEVD